MKLERCFLEYLINDYGISERIIKKINVILSDILNSYEIKLMEDEYLDLFEYCCMNVSTSRSMLTSDCRRQSISSAISNTLMIFSRENNWNFEVELNILEKEKRIVLK